MNRHTIKSIRKLTWPTVLVRETYRNTRRRLPCCRVLSNSRYVVGLSVFARQSCYVPNPLVCQNQVYLLLYRTETTLTVAHPMRGRGPANKPRENTVVGGGDPPDLKTSIAKIFQTPVCRPMKVIRAPRFDPFSARRRYWVPRQISCCGPVGATTRWPFFGGPPRDDLAVHPGAIFRLSHTVRLRQFYSLCCGKWK